MVENKKSNLNLDNDPSKSKTKSYIIMDNNNNSFMQMNYSKCHFKQHSLIIQKEKMCF